MPANGVAAASWWPAARSATATPVPVVASSAAAMPPVSRRRKVMADMDQGPLQGFRTSGLISLCTPRCPATQAGRFSCPRPGVVEILLPNGLLRVFGGSRLADDGDANLAGVGQPFFDLLGHVARDHLGRDVVDLVGLAHDADLATRLHGEDLLHARLLGGNLLDALQPLDVVLERLTAGARPATTDAVGGLREHGLDGADLDLVVV